MNKKDQINSDNRFDELLLKWYDGELDGQELSDFEADPRFQAYQQIEEQTKVLNKPTFNQDAILVKIKDEIKEKTVQPKVIPLWKKLASIAAIAVVIFAAISFFSADVSVNSYHAIQLSHALPDGSQVILNSDSELEYEDSFNEDRTLNLKGEAFFQVEKGKSFTVVTDLGDVVVLGTSFNVLARKENFVVSCKTGKVEVTSNNHSKIITPGERIRFTNKNVGTIEKIDPNKIDSWSTGESYFERTPLHEVINALSHKYDTNIDLPTKYHERLFTGSFIHSDLDKALKMVLVPMGIEYKSGDRVTIF